VAYARALYPGAGERCGFSRNEPYANRPQANAAQGFCVIQLNLRAIQLNLRLP
jgi:hypothetical protein